MLPLVALKVCDTGTPRDLMADVVRKAQEAAERRRRSLNGNGEFALPPSELPQDRDDANKKVLQKVAERGARVADDVARQAAEEAEQAREREERAAASAAQLELRRAEEALKARSDTEDPSSDESDVVSIGPDDDDEGAAEDLDALFDDMEEEEAIEAQRFLAVDQIDSIHTHMKEALSEIKAAMDAMENDDQRTILFGVATRLRADMRLLFAVRQALLNANDPLVRSPRFRGDMQRVDQLVREATAKQQADGAGGSPNATAARWNSVVLPLLGMLLFLLSAYMFPGMPMSYPMLDAEELPVVYPYYNLTNEPETVVPEEPFIIVPNTTPTDLKTFRGRFHKAVASALSTASSNRTSQHQSN